MDDTFSARQSRVLSVQTGQFFHSTPDQQNSGRSLFVFFRALLYTHYISPCYISQEDIDWPVGQTNFGGLFATSRCCDGINLEEQLGAVKVVRPSACMQSMYWTTILTVRARSINYHTQRAVCASVLHISRRTYSRVVHKRN